jgi:hypothetical protein
MVDAMVGAAPKTEETVATELEKVTLAQQRASRARLGFAAFTVIAAVGTGYFYDRGTGILVLAGGILLAVIGVLWASVRTLSGDAPITLEEAVALGAPTAAEAQKRAVLQALKDLEYERSMGKIAEADYVELLARYRNEAKRLLRAVDENLAPMRAKAEAYVAAQLEGLNRNAPPRSEKPAAAVTVTSLPCPTCRASNDVDALFCKKCGAKLAAAKDHQDAIA